MALKCRAFITFGLQELDVMHNLVGKIIVVVVDDSGEFILNPNND